MKLYDSIGPNPHTVRMFMAEKGIELEKQTVDLRSGENREGAYLKVNPRGQCPALEIDNGQVITEITAICEYLDDIQPDPPLIGTTPDERGETRMWVRRIDLTICEPMGAGFRFSDGLKMFENRIRCLPEAADGLKAIARDNLAWLEEKMTGKTWITGDRFTLADVLLYCFLVFGERVGQGLDDSHPQLQGWFKRCSERPSASA